MSRVRIRSEKGQAMAEFAVITPLLMLVVVAIVQFGVTFNNYIVLTDAVREGARTAAVSRHYTDRDTRTKDKVRASSAGLDTSTSKLVIDVVSDWEPGSDVTVRAQYPYKISLLGRVLLEGSLKSHTVERVE